MPLTSMTKILPHAIANKYGVGAFNPVDYNSMKAIVAAAEALDAPVIAQTSAKTIKYWGHAALGGWMQEITANTSVPVSFHLDHCHDLDMIRGCIENGWTDVMIDASAKPFDENLALSKQVVDMARAAGVGVEAELGQIVGVEDGIFVDERDAHLTEPADAERFCAELELAVFAPAIGTAHGYYKGEPQVAFERIEEIYRITGVPLALHGGTGLDDDVFTRAITCGCAKINISTQLKHAFVDGFVSYNRDNPSDYEPLRLIEAQYKALLEVFSSRIEQFGGAGQGARLLGAGS